MGSLYPRKITLDSSRQFFGFGLVENNNFINRGHSAGLSLLLDETRELSCHSPQEKLLVVSQIKDDSELLGSSDCLIHVSLVESRFYPDKKKNNKLSILFYGREFS